MNKTVAIQGIKGSFHHIAALQYFKDKDPISVKECLSFDTLVRYLIHDIADIGVMAIENSIAGSIISNYALIDNNNLNIVGEYYLNIQHHLLSLPNQTILDIKEVCSHPMALLQCKHFFEKHPHIKLVEDKDTAETAKRIQEQQLKGIAAIASFEAAKLFKLDVLASHIQEIQNNETRFLILTKREGRQNNDIIDKVSIKFETKHEPGNLASILNVMSACKMNLTKIQSLPIINTPWKYAFFADVTFKCYDDFQKLKHIIEIIGYKMKLLGEYKDAKS